jgi:NAD(P)-dependent dehydrogenase (short-subunit alcohol dehydrogenase family)
VQCALFFVDVCDTASIFNMVEAVKSKTTVIDVLVNNAGISQRSLAAETQMQVDRMVMETNYFSTVLLTKSLWPLLLQSKQGQVVLMSSLTGTFGFPLRSAYAAAKHAVEGFFESWELENKSKVSFSIIAPGRANQYFLQCINCTRQCTRQVRCGAGKWNQRTTVCTKNYKSNN